MNRKNIYEHRQSWVSVLTGRDKWHKDGIYCDFKEK